MPPNNQTRTRSGRVSQIDISPNWLMVLAAKFWRGDVLLRVAICCISVVTMWLATGGWRPVFPYRTFQTPKRNIVTRTSFEVEDQTATANARDRARSNIECVYDHEVQRIYDLREALKTRVFDVLAAANLEELNRQAWAEFAPQETSAKATEYSPDDAFLAFRQGLVGDENLESFEQHFAEATEEMHRYGLLTNVQHELGEGDQTEISVNRDSKLLHRVPIERVRIAEALPRLMQKLTEEFGSNDVAEPVFYWVKKNVTPTLTFNRTATELERKKAEEAVATVMIQYNAGEAVLAEGGKPLTTDSVNLLRREHAAFVEGLSWTRRVVRSLAGLGMYVALYMLCGAYIYFRRPELIYDFRRFITLQAIAVATVALCRLCAWDRWQAETMPLILFAMTVAIAHGQEMALLLSAAMCLVVCISLGLGLTEFVVFAATMAATILLLRHIRSRTKLIYIGLAAAGVAFLTALGVGTVGGVASLGVLFATAGWYALFVLLAAIMMTGILPFVEAVLDVQTEISLLELGDVAHPLLQELVRRAPGTYNHSINVASIAEAAAESIGANGLLVRVGAYFHDIGKMLKPQYFVENQGDDPNRHEALLPAMSTLIIIAHVKDGADLARQHHLPKPIIDFILQHHGTTLVEYFYDRANRQSEEDPHASEVDEGSYRYPGPRPQSREAAVLMLSDAVESASRSLQEPTPARIESLVKDIAMKRLLDGQFDDCQLTLQELRTIQDSLVKSVTAVYHGRVKYPDQQSA